jgi:diguanylate cyclase (GGDEF)-like protein
MIFGLILVILIDAFNQNRIVPMEYFYFCYALIGLFSVTTIILVSLKFFKKVKSTWRLRIFYWGFWFINTFLVASIYLMDAYSTGTVASIFAFYLILATVPVLNLFEIFIFLFVPNIIIVLVWGIGVLTMKETVYSLVLYEFFALAISQAMYQTYYRLLDAEQKLQQSRLQLEKMSLADPLTGLLNRYGLDQAFTKLKQANTARDKLFVIIIDIDFFKDYNDCYGHLRGDECLVKVSQMIIKCFSDISNTAGRIGGDEFVVLLANHTKEEVENKIKLLYQTIGELHYCSANQSVSKILTVSSGIAAAPFSTLDSWTDLFEKSDRVLYKIKNSGRNQYLFSEDVNLED